MSDGEESFISHLEALRGALLRCVAVTAALFPLGYFLAPRVISALTAWCFSDGAALHYFAPMEVFFVQLRLALVIALVLAYPWNAAQIWRFVLPALYKDERRARGEHRHCELRGTRGLAHARLRPHVPDAGHSPAHGALRRRIG